MNTDIAIDFMHIMNDRLLERAKAHIQLYHALRTGELDALMLDFKLLTELTIQEMLEFETEPKRQSLCKDIIFTYKK